MSADDLEQARLDRLADLVTLEDLAADQLDYLAHVDQLEDPETDGFECSDVLEDG